MAKSAVESEFELKKRLVGAFVLIGFGVIILPALLGGKGPQFGEEGAPVTPRLESKVFVSKITPIGGETPQRISGTVQTKKPEPIVEAATPVPARVSPANTGNSGKSIAKTEPAAPQKLKPKSKPVANTNEPGWVVRIGTFAKQDNVERVVKRLQQAGFEPSTTNVKTDRDSVTRVWIGPYSKRVEAARMRTRVRQVTGGEGYIAAYP